jgi:hypothetical protein
MVVFKRLRVNDALSTGESEECDRTQTFAAYYERGD